MASGFVVAPARAETPVRITLDWTDTTEPCLRETEIRRDVATRLGYPPFESTAERHVQGVVKQLANGFQVELRVFVGRTLVGARSISGETCEALGAAAGLALALAIDPTVLERAPSASPQGAVRAFPATPPPPPEVARTADCPVPERGPLACPPAPPPSAPPSASSPDSALRGEIGLLARASSGAAPQTSIGPELRASVHLGDRWRVALNLGWRPEVRTSDGRVGIAQGGAQVELCRRLLERGGSQLFLCGGFEFGEQVALVRGIASGQAGGQFWAGVQAGPWAVLGVSRRWSVALGTQLFVPLMRHRYWLGNALAHEERTYGASFIAGPLLQW